MCEAEVNQAGNTVRCFCCIKYLQQTDECSDGVVSELLECIETEDSNNTIIVE